VLTSQAYLAGLILMLKLILKISAAQIPGTVPVRASLPLRMTRDHFEVA
jgi:hypothetical protein